MLNPFKGDNPEPTPAQIAGESDYTGHVLPGQYSTAGCELEEEHIAIQLDDGPVVTASKLEARGLRYMIGFWQDNMPVTVTCFGSTNHIKRVQVLSKVQESGLDATLTVEDLQ